jgi:two-component system, cell cycle sensor histidine kinase and response regulator CckA
MEKNQKPEEGSGCANGEVVTILLVEDEPSVRKLIQAVLRGSRLNIMAAMDGREALEILARHEKTIHLLIADITLPFFSGKDVAKEFTRRHPGGAVLFITGYIEEELSADLNGPLLQKPFAPAELIEHVVQLLHGQRPKTLP